MRLSEFDFRPPPRAASRSTPPGRATPPACCTSAPDGLADRIVRDLPDLLRPGDILVANDTRVIPAQLAARRGRARIGITLDRPLPDGTWHALARNTRRLRPGDPLDFDAAPELSATVVSIGPEGDVILRFDSPDAGSLPSPVCPDPGSPTPR